MQRAGLGRVFPRSGAALLYVSPRELGCRLPRNRKGGCRANAPSPQSANRPVPPPVSVRDVRCCGARVVRACAWCAHRAGGGRRSRRGSGRMAGRHRSAGRGVASLDDPGGVEMGGCAHGGGRSRARRPAAGWATARTAAGGGRATGARGARTAMGWAGRGAWTRARARRRRALLLCSYLPARGVCGEVRALAAERDARRTPDAPEEERA